MCNNLKFPHASLTKKFSTTLKKLLRLIVKLVRKARKEKVKRRRSEVIA
jgi:hypothetical protein